jgi:hypothetical protein
MIESKLVGHVNGLQLIGIPLSLSKVGSALGPFDLPGLGQILEVFTI